MPDPDEAGRDAGGGTAPADHADAVEAGARRVRSALVGFVRRLRRRGVDVPANAAVPAAEALAVVGFRDEDRARAALRAALVSRPSDVEAFDRLFEAFWDDLDRRIRAGTDPVEPADPGGDSAPGEVATVAADLDGRGRARGEAPDERGAGTPRDGTVRRVDDVADGDRAAADYSRVGGSEPVSAAEAPASASPDGAVERLARAVAERAGRRRTSSGRGGGVDARRALRRSFGTGGVPVSLPGRERKRTDASALALVDVSRSVLDVVDRGFLLAFLRALHAECQSARTFLFDTSIREVTGALERAGDDGVHRALARAEAEWGGGTRIGHALATVRDRHPRAVDSGTAAVVISDGLERGDVDRLESGVVWLSRRAGTLCWLNPLAASPEYEPTCRGMAAAVPYLDGLFPFAGPADLAWIARHLERHDAGSVLGYEYDRRPERRTGEA